MSRAEKAKEYFLQGYACSQAVALAFSDLVGTDEATLCKMMLPFGGGLGRLRLTCGAVSGMAATAGLLLAESTNSPENKKKTYEAVQKLCAEFQEENGSLICAELLSNADIPVKVKGETSSQGNAYKKRPCGDIVYSATEILEKYLKERGVL